MPDIAVNGVRLRYDDTGGDRPVVAFSHGLLWSRHMFRDQIGALRDRFRCVSWDHRGQGESEVPPGRVCTIEDCYADAVALIEALHLGPVHFVGLSMGGFVGMRLAARRPELVRSLALLDTAADPEPRKNVPKYRAMVAVARWFGVRGALADRVMPIMFSRTFLADPAMAERRAEWRGRLMTNAPSIYKAVNGVIERDAFTDHLGAIRCPTVVIRGDEDTAIAETRARALAEGIAGARYVSVPRAGHTATVENAPAVNEALIAFLDEVG